MAIVNVDGIKIDTTFIQEYLSRPEGDPVRAAALKWQEQQATKTRKAQPQRQTTVGGVSVTAAQAPSPTVIRPQEIVAKAKAKTLADQRSANAKARAAGAALPYPSVGEAAATSAQGGIPGAGRGTTETTKSIRESERPKPQKTVSLTGSATGTDESQSPSFILLDVQPSKVITAYTYSLNGTDLKVDKVEFKIPKL